ncbi:PIR protein [Plasmodium vivax]|uniref:VIR protein n=1 Tax=Plasmodium vivax TaxID=5855 RepID=A0A565A8L1_PLAVI|nr:PIR protein [Plasmodium vivax]
MAEDYTFFKDSYFFIRDEKYALTTNLFGYYGQNCNKLQDWERDYTDICIKFKKMINFINGKKSIGTFNLDHTYKPYMNFWLNYQLGQLNNSMFTAENFYKMIEEQDPVFFTHNFKIKAHIISKNDLEDMEKLYDLYNAYYDIMTMDHQITDGCITKAKKCVTLYNDHIQACATGVKESFCKALLDFKQEYNKLKNEPKCSKTNLPELPGLPQSQQLQGLAQSKELKELAQSQDSQGLSKTQDLQGLAKAQELQGLPSNDHVIIPSATLDTDSQQTQEQFQAEGIEFISGEPTELSPEKNNFTPLGSWFRRKIQRKKVNVGYLEEESHKLFDITERQYKNYDKMKYGISYKSFAGS